MLFSAQTGEGLDDLVDRIAREAAATDVLLSADIPYREGALITLVHEQGTLLHEEYLEDGVRIVAKLPDRIAPRLERYLNGINQLQYTQDNRLMKQVERQCMASEACERRDGIFIGPCWCLAVCFLSRARGKEACEVHK